MIDQAQNEEQPKRSVTVREACEYLGCGKTTLYALMERREIRAYNIGKATRISKASLDEYITANAWTPQQCRA